MRRQLRKSEEQEITNMVKALQRRGMAIPDIIATIADAQGFLKLKRKNTMSNYQYVNC